MHARPCAIRCGLPLTGAATNPTPASAASSRTPADAALDTVEQSTTNLGRAAPPSRLPTTASRSRGVDTVTNTISAAARPASSSTATAPWSTSGPSFDRVRFHTSISLPAASKREARAEPIRPVPSQPSVVISALEDVARAAPPRTSWFLSAEPGH